MVTKTLSEKSGIYLILLEKNRNLQFANDRGASQATITYLASQPLDSMMLQLLPANLILKNHLLVLLKQ